MRIILWDFIIPRYMQITVVCELEKKNFFKVEKFIKIGGLSKVLFSQNVSKSEMENEFSYLSFKENIFIIIWL